jgi:hypothetical protein
MNSILKTLALYKHSSFTSLPSLLLVPFCLRKEKYNPPYLSMHHVIAKKIKRPFAIYNCLQVYIEMKNKIVFKKKKTV